MCRDETSARSAVSVFQSAELDQPLRLSLNFSLFRELLSSLSSHVHATCDQPACATAHTRIRYILHTVDFGLARRHRHDAPGTLKCQKTYTTIKDSKVCHTGAQPRRMATESESALPFSVRIRIMHIVRRP